MFEKKMKKNINLLLMLMLILFAASSIKSQSIQAHAQLPITLQFSNINKLYPIITLRFALNNKSVGLEYGQFIGVEFPDQLNLNLNTLLNNKPPFTCELKSIIDNEIIETEPENASESLIDSSSSVETNIAFCKLTDINKKIKLNDFMSLKIQFLSKTAYFKNNLIPPIRLFTSTSSSPHRIVLDTNYSFSEIGLYKDLSNSSNNVISITSTNAVNCNNSTYEINSIPITTACTNLYPFENFDIELIGKFNQSINDFSQKYDIIITIPTVTFGTNNPENTGNINIDKLVFSSEDVLNTKNQVTNSKFEFGSYSKMSYLGEKTAFVFKNLKTTAIKSGRKFRIIFKNAIGTSTGNIRIEIHVLYKNSYSSVGYSSSDRINLNVIPIIKPTSSFSSVFNVENNDVFAPGGYHIMFAFNFESELDINNVFIKIQHANHDIDENYLNMVASTCDFTHTEGLSKVLGKRPICHPINKTLNTDSIRHNKRSGIIFRLSELSGISKIEKGKTFIVKVFTLFEVCGKASTDFIDVMAGVVENSRVTNIPYVKPEFTIEAYTKLSFTSDGEVELSNLIAQTKSNFIFNNKCYQTYNPSVITTALSEKLYLSSTDPLSRNSDDIINPLLAKEFTDFRLAYLLNSDSLSKLLDLPVNTNDVSDSDMKVGYLFSKDETVKLSKEITTITDRPVFYLAVYLQNEEDSNTNSFPFHFANQFAGPFAFYPSTITSDFAKIVRGKLRLQFTNTFFKYSDETKIPGCELSWYSNSVVSQNSSAVAAQITKNTDSGYINYLINNSNPLNETYKIESMDCQLEYYNQFQVNNDPTKIDTFPDYNNNQRNIFLTSNLNLTNFSASNYLGIGKSWTFLYDLVNNNSTTQASTLNRTQKSFCDIAFRTNCVEYRTNIASIKSIYTIFEVNVQWLGDDQTTVIRNNRFVKMFPEGVAFHDESKQLNINSSNTINPSLSDITNNIIYHYSYVEYSRVCIVEINSLLWSLQDIDSDFNTITLFLYGIALLEEDVNELTSDTTNSYNSYPISSLIQNYNEDNINAEIERPYAYGFTSAPVTSTGFNFTVEKYLSDREDSVPNGYQTPESYYRVYLGSLLYITNIKNNNPSIDKRNLLIPVYCPILPQENINQLNRENANMNYLYTSIVFLNMDNEGSISNLNYYFVSSFLDNTVTKKITYFPAPSSFPSSVTSYLGTARFTPYDIEDPNKDLYIINGNINNNNNIAYKPTVSSIFLSDLITTGINDYNNYPDLFYNINSNIDLAYDLFEVMNKYKMNIMGKSFTSVILTKFKINETTNLPYSLDLINNVDINKKTTTRLTSSIFLTGIHKPSFDSLSKISTSLFNNIAFFLNTKNDNSIILSNFIDSSAKFILDYNPSTDSTSEDSLFTLNLYSNEKFFKKDAKFGGIKVELTFPNIPQYTYVDLISTNENFNDSTLCGIEENSGFNNLYYVYPCNPYASDRISCYINKYIISSNYDSYSSNNNYLHDTNKINICCSNITTKDSIAISKVRNSLNSSVSGFPANYITPYYLIYDTSDSSYSINNVYLDAYNKNDTSFSAKISSLYYDPRQTVQSNGIGVVYINIEVPIGIQRGATYVIEGDFSNFYLNSKIKHHCSVLISNINASSTYLPQYNDYSKDIGASLVEDCYIGDLTQRIESGEDVLSSNKGIKINIKNMLLKCSMSIGKYIVLVISPIRVISKENISSTLFTVHSYLDSVLLNLSKENQFNVYQEFKSAPINKTLYSSMCNIIYFSPIIAGVRGSLTVEIDTSRYFKELNTSRAKDEVSNEISIYFPIEVYGRILHNVSENFIMCFIGGNYYPCEANIHNFVNIKFPDSLGYQNGEVYEISIYGIIIPYFGYTSTSSSVSDLSKQALVCSINYNNVFDNTRKNIVFGYGEISSNLPVFNSSSVTTSYTAYSNSDKTDLSLKYIAALQISSITNDSLVDNKSLPRTTDNITLKLKFDSQFGLNPPFKMSISPIKFHISFSDAFNIMIDKSKQIYAYEYYKISISIIEVDVNNNEKETSLSISDLALISNTITLTLSDTSINFSSEFSYIKIVLNGLTNSDKETSDIGMISVIITDSEFKYMLRTMTNINLQYGDGTISPVVSEYITKSRGWGLRYSNELNKAALFINPPVESSKYNDFKFIDSSNNLNKIYLNPGRYSSQTILVKNPYNSNSSNTNNSRFLDNASSYKTTTFYLKDTVFETMNSTYSISNKHNDETSFYFGVPCGYMPGVYIPKFYLSNTTDFYPLPLIITEVLFNTSKGIIYLHSKQLTEITENNIVSNLIASSFYLGTAKSTYLFYSVLEPPVDDLIIGFQPKSTNKNKSYMSYSTLQAKSNTNTIKYSLLSSTSIVQKYTPYSPNYCYEMFPDDVISFIHSN